MGVTGLLGGAFDPPHVGHVAVAEAARRELGLAELVVLVSERPSHKDVAAPADARLRLACAAFPDERVELDPNPRTIDLLRAHDWVDPVFVVGADEFCDFLTWKEPDAVLELARLGVATRPGYPRERLQAVLDGLARPERVLFFELEPVDVSSSEIRDRVVRGAAIEGLVPPAVASLIAELDLYRDGSTSAGAG